MKLFSPEKANALIPVLTPLIEDLWKKRRELAIALLENDPALRAPAQSPASAAPERRAAMQRCTDLKGEIVGAIDRIQAYGCLVKDIDLGLIDFAALKDGEPIYLCWKMGEDSVGHWHRPTENFYGRKTL